MIQVDKILFMPNQKASTLAYHADEKNYILTGS